MTGLQQKLTALFLGVCLTLAGCDTGEEAHPLKQPGAPYRNMDGVYIIDKLSQQSGTLVGIACRGSMVLTGRSSDASGTLALTVYDSSSDTVQANATVPVSSCDQLEIGFTAAGDVYLYDIGAQEIRLLDGKLKELGSIRLPQLRGAGLYIDEEGSYAWGIEKTSGQLIRFSMDGKRSEAELRLSFQGSPVPKQTRIIGLMGDGKTLVMECESANAAPVLAVCNIDSGELRVGRTTDGTLYLSSGMLIRERNGEMTTVDPQKQGAALTFSFSSASEQVQALSQGLVVTLDTAFNGENTTVAARIYDARQGICKSEVQLFSGTKEELEGIAIGNLCLCDDRAYFTVDNALEATQQLVVWDFANMPSSGRTVGDAVLSIGGTDYRAQNDTLVTQLQEKYGIRIYLRDDAVVSFHDYVVCSDDDETHIYAALSQISTLLGKFPEGFLDDLCTAAVEGVDFFLTGTIKPISQESGIDAAAFACQHNRRQALVIDISEPEQIQGHLAHELMHAIDTRLSYARQMEGYPGFSLWNEFLPDGYLYTYSYRDVTGAVYSSANRADYTPDDPKSKDDVNRIYFIDGYASTFPTEDRARIFESLVISDQKLPACFESEPLMQKAEYLCAVLRDYFPSVRRAESVSWERFLSGRPLSWFTEERIHFPE